MPATGNAVGRLALAALPYTVFIYAVATLTSMAGMEMAGGLMQALVVLYFLSDVRSLRANVKRFGTRADWALLILFATVVVGAFTTDSALLSRADVIGSARWTLLFFLTRAAVGLTWSKNAQPAFAILIAVTGLIAFYALFQSVTGVPSFRAHGLFGSPFTFAHSMAMTACFPFAFAFLGVWREHRVNLTLALWALACGLSVVASFDRGAWYALSAALLVMMALAGGRRLVAVLAVLLVLAAALWLWAPGLVDPRAASVLDSDFRSGLDRVSSWNANSQAFVGAAIVGLACYLFFAAYFFWITVRAWFLIPTGRSWERAAVLGALGAQVALHVGGLSASNFEDAAVNHLFLLILAVAAAIYGHYLDEHGGLIKRPRNETSPSGI